MNDKQKIEELEARIAGLKADKFTYCAYCGEEFPIDAEGTPEAVSNHIRTCPKHPLSQARADTAREIIKDVEGTLDITDDTYVRISNHVPFDAWQALKSRWGGE